jgi:hypothetical protein
MSAKRLPGCQAPRVAVRLKGKAANTRGVGAKIKFFGGPVPQSQEMISGGRYMSGDDAMRVFAAGGMEKSRIESIPGICFLPRGSSIDRSRVEEK